MCQQDVLTHYKLVLVVIAMFFDGNLSPVESSDSIFLC
jgi:hypothetical protein